MERVLSLFSNAKYYPIIHFAANYHKLIDFDIFALQKRLQDNKNRRFYS